MSKKKEGFGLGTLLLSVVSYACLKGLEAINAKMEKDAAKKKKGN